MEESYTPTPECHDLQYLFDISGWLAEHIVPIKNHVYPHTFKFYLGEDKKAKMLYKNWANDETWQPADGPLTILKSVPEGAPKLVRPTLGGRDTMPLKDLKAKVQAGSHRMTEDQLHWWEDFIRDEQTLRSRWDGMTDEGLKELVQENWYIPKLRTHQREATPACADHSAARQDKELERLLNKENSFPPVSVIRISSILPVTHAIYDAQYVDFSFFFSISDNSMH